MFALPSLSWWRVRSIKKFQFHLNKHTHTSACKPAHKPKWNLQNFGPPWKSHSICCVCGFPNTRSLCVFPQQSESRSEALVFGKNTVWWCETIRKQIGFIFFMVVWRVEWVRKADGVYETGNTSLMGGKEIENLRMICSEWSRGMSHHRTVRANEISIFGPFSICAIICCSYVRDFVVVERWKSIFAYTSNTELGFFGI